jgi:hypothetical protein
MKSSVLGDTFDIAASASVSSTESMQNTIFTAHYSKSLLFINKSPKIMKITIYSFLLVILIYLTVTFYNFGNFLNKYNNITNRIQSMGYIGERNTDF